MLLFCSIITKLKDTFLGHRDYYSLVKYLKFRVEEKDIDDDLIMEAFLRNFSGLTRTQMEETITLHIQQGLLEDQITDLKEILDKYSPLQLISDNINQTRKPRNRVQKLKQNMPIELRNIMVIVNSEGTVVFLFLFFLTIFVFY